MKATKKTLKGFFENCSNPQLYKKVWKMTELTFDELKQNPRRFLILNRRDITTMIVRENYQSFTNRHLYEILDFINDFDKRTGLDTRKQIEKFSNKFYWLFWFTYTTMIKELITYLKDNNPKTHAHHVKKTKLTKSFDADNQQLK